MRLFLTIAIVHLLALMSPGPDFLFVSQTAVSRSRRQALFGVAGIALGIAAWAALALLGLHWLLQRLAWLQQLIAVAGGLYLAWLGMALCRSALRPATVAVAVGAPASPRSDLATLRTGLFTNLANPKAVVYFGSVFSGLLGDASATARGQLWLLVSIESLLWFTLVAMVFGIPLMRRGYLRLARGIDALAGAVFIGFGLHLLLASRAG